MERERDRRWLWVVLILVIPWIGAIFYFWWHRPKDGAIPRSMGDEAREHLDGV